MISAAPIPGSRQYFVIPDRCPKCHADGRWIEREGDFLSHPASLAGCGWTGVLVSSKPPRPSSETMPPRRLRGGERHRAGHTCTSGRCAAIIAAFHAGVLYEAIAAEYRVTRQAIGAVLAAHGLRRRAGRRFRPRPIKP